MKYEDALNKYDVNLNDQEIAQEVQQIIADNFEANKDKIGAVACFGTSAMMKSMKKPMKKVLDELGIPLLEDEFHCRGSFGPANKGRPNEGDLKAAQIFALNLIEKENA